MRLCTQMRLQVRAADAAALEFRQGKCRGLSTWWGMRLRDGERWPGWAAAKATLEASKQHDPERRFGYGKLLHAVYFRLEKALTAFVRRGQAQTGEKPGFPRGRPRHCFFPRCSPSRSITRAGDRRSLPTGGGGKTGSPQRSPTSVVRLTASAPATSRAGALSRAARGNSDAAFVTEQLADAASNGGLLALDLGIKTLATGVNAQGRIYTVGAARDTGHHCYTHQLDTLRSQRDRCQKRSRRSLHLSEVSQRVAERKRKRKRNKQRDCLHKAAHLIAYRLVESTVVIGDLSQRQMVTKAHQQKSRDRNRAVCNDWGRYRFVSMLTDKCRHAGKQLQTIGERYTTQECCRCQHRQAMPLWKRTYRCGNADCGLVLDRDVNSAITILQRFLARLGPHTDESVRCAAQQCSNQHV